MTESSQFLVLPDAVGPKSVPDFHLGRPTKALVLGALEARTPKDAWRNATPSWAHHVSSAEYLRWLTDNGYTLAAVEEIVTGAKPPMRSTTSI